PGVRGRLTRLGLHALELRVQFLVGGGKHPRERRTAVMLGGVVDLAETGAAPKERDELPGPPLDHAKREPLAQDDGPGKQREDPEPRENRETERAVKGETPEKRACSGHILQSQNGRYVHLWASPSSTVAAVWNGSRGDKYIAFG